MIRRYEFDRLDAIDALEFSLVIRRSDKKILSIETLRRFVFRLNRSGKTRKKIVRLFFSGFAENETCREFIIMVIKGRPAKRLQRCFRRCVPGVFPGRTWNNV